MPRWLIQLIVLIASGLSPASLGMGPADLFRIDRSPATGAEVLVLGAEVLAPNAEQRQAPMLARIAGTLAILDRAQTRELVALARASRVSIAPDDPQLTPMVDVVLRRDSQSKRLTIVRDPAGTIYAKGPGRHNQPELVMLDTPRWHALARSWSAYSGPIISPPPDLPSPGQVVMIHNPTTPGPVVLDRRELGKRLARGSSIRMAPTTRVLAEETLTARLPAGFDLRHPAGLLIWIDPSNAGVPPPSLYQACDELNLVLVGAVNAGNNRPVVDRFQLAFDGMAWAMEHVPIDASRVYLTGMSGGGRAVSMLWASYPDLFAGAVAIVGLNSYKRALTPRDTILPATYAKPAGRLLALLRTRRLAAITGAQDFNEESIHLYAKGLVRDHLPVRVFDYVDMGHAMPTPGRFSEAMRWVDEPKRTALVQARARAGLTLQSLADELADPPTPDQRQALIEIIRSAPWTAPAWQAAALLGYVPG